MFLFIILFAIYSYQMYSKVYFVFHMNNTIHKNYIESNNYLANFLLCIDYNLLHNINWQINNLYTYSFIYLNVLKVFFNIFTNG
jgi:hypothetical protein